MKKVLLLVLTIVFTLSLASMAFAANTSATSTEATGSTNYNNYPSGYGVPGGDLNSTLATYDMTYDNGLINANQTGVGNGTQAVNPTAVKTVGGQRTHGEYQNNTNSCASCHQVHTAAGDSLLFKDGVYETCTACHDGTLGVLNVFAGSTAGTFGGTAAGHASMHLASGVMETKAAPGGNHNATQDSKGNDTSIGGTWSEEFNCASCHSPHGSYSDRLLNYNPNGVGEKDMFFRTATTPGSLTDENGTLLAATAPSVKTGGQKLAGIPVVDALPTAYATNDSISPEFVAFRTMSDNTALDDPATTTNESITAAMEPTPVKVIVVMKKMYNSTSKTYYYARDLTPWIGNVYNFRGDGKIDPVTGKTRAVSEASNFYAGSYSFDAKAQNYVNAAPVRFSANPTLNAAYDELIVKWSFGYVKNGPQNGIDTVTYADICRATVVKLGFLPTQKATYNNLPVKEVDISTYDNAGYGVQINAFCATCHYDYFNASGSLTGTWSKAFRHNTKSDSYTCLKCHFAHGTDVTVMLDAQDHNINDLVNTTGYIPNVAGAATLTDVKNYLLDNNASSALKRYTNMAVCWKCHTSSHSEDLTNNQWYQGGVSTGFGSNEFTNSGTNVPQGWVDANQSTLPYAGNQTTPTSIILP